MLPFCDRTIRIERKGLLPCRHRGVPVPKDPKTIGEHLRKRRHELGMLNREAAHKLRVSRRTLSLWEWDEAYPTWTYQPRLIAYLGYDPFDNPSLGRPLGNETTDVAVLCSIHPLSLGQQLAKLRMELRKTRKDLAKEIGVSEKTLKWWETNRRLPLPSSQRRIMRFLQQSRMKVSSLRGEGF